MDICLIWAQARHRKGHDGSASWLGAEDLRRFQSVTERHPVLMGCRTWEMIPRALVAGRQSFVLTKRQTSLPGAVACTSLDEAFTLASVMRTGKLFLLGGSSLYEQGLRVADRLYLACLEPDEVELPAIDARRFELVRQDRTGSIGPARLLKEYRRRPFH